MSEVGFCEHPDHPAPAEPGGGANATNRIGDEWLCDEHVFVPRSRAERTLIRWTVADADASAGREVTEDEIDRLEKALGHSTMAEAFAEVVFAVCNHEDEICGEVVERREGEWVHIAAYTEHIETATRHGLVGVGQRCWPGKHFFAFPEMPPVVD